MAALEVLEMALSFATQTLPLASDCDGVVRVRDTRVTLDTVVSAFCDGATPEEIVQQYPSLDLADVYQEPERGPLRPARCPGPPPFAPYRRRALAA